MRLLSPLLLLIVACKGGRSADVGPGPSGGPAVCAVSAAVPDANEGVTVVIDRASGPFAEARFRMRRLVVDAPGGADLTLSGGLALFDLDGNALDGVVPAGSAGLELLVQGTSVGPASLELTPVGSCAEPVARLNLEVRRPVDLAGRPVLGGPGFSLVDVFNADEPVSIGFDGRDHPDRVGQSFDAWVVAHRTPGEWAADPTLVDAADGPVAGTVAEASRADSAIAVWSSTLSVPPDRVSAAYDVVLDFDGDGLLGPGDWIDGLERPGFHAVRDLTDPGPRGVVTSEVSGGFWTTQRVYAPDGGGPAPLVVISHGNGHDYTWYDYLGEHFASWGYVVISHRNDTEPGPVSAAATTLQNTEAFLANWAALGLPVDVDGSRIALIGHSRGGEGVVIAYHQLVSGGGGVSSFDAGDVRLVQSIAPTLFEGPDGANPHDVAFHLLAGSADGDVTGGPDSAALQYFRMFQRSTGDGFVTYVQGADHNDFNCCGMDDGTWWTVQGNPPLIGRARAQDVAKSYLLAVLERELMDNPAPADFLARSPEQYAPIAVDAVVATQAMPSDALVIEDFQTQPDRTVSSSGAAVSDSGLTWGEGALDDANTQLSWTTQDQANAMTWSNNDGDPARGAIVEWAAGEEGWIAWEVAAGSRDWTDLDEISVRACQGSRHPNTLALGDYLSFSIELEDGSGSAALVEAAPYGRVTPPYPRGGLGGGTGWVNELQTVRVPLEDFRAGATQVDLSDIAVVRLHFGAAFGSSTGRMGFDDLEVVRR